MILSLEYGRAAYPDPECKAGDLIGSDPAAHEVRSLSIFPETTFLQAEQFVTAVRQETNVA